MDTLECKRPHQISCSRLRAETSKTRWTCSVALQLVEKNTDVEIGDFKITDNLRDIQGHPEISFEGL